MPTTYSDKLKDPRWQKKRLEIFERDKWTCQCCSETENTLHVHYREYKRGAEPWEYENGNFVTLCQECHSGLKGIEDSGHMRIAEAFEMFALGICDGHDGAAINEYQRRRKIWLEARDNGIEGDPLDKLFEDMFSAFEDMRQRLKVSFSKTLSCRLGGSNQLSVALLKDAGAL